MTEKKRKSKAGSPRTEVFAMRLDPKLKYLAEIAARKQRRSLANFIEWAIEQALTSVSINDSGVTVMSVGWQLWSLDEQERLRKLAQTYPELLTYDEQLIWRVIFDHSVYDNELERLIRFVGEHGLDMDLVRACWQEIKAYALDSGTKNELDSAMCHHSDVPF
jgi:hypothetical protein